MNQNSGNFFVNAVARERNMIDDQNLNNFFKDDLILFSEFDFSETLQEPLGLCPAGAHRVLDESHSVPFS